MNEVNGMEEPQPAADLGYLESQILSIPFSVFHPCFCAVLHTHTWPSTDRSLSSSPQHLKNWGLPLLGASFNVHEMIYLFMD